MADEFPIASLSENLVFNLFHVLPYYLQGIFRRNRFWVTFWTQIHPDFASVKFFQRLRHKYKAKCLYIYMLKNKSLVILDSDAIKHILDNSPSIYAEADLKRRGMSHFQPNAVTISHGEDWIDRRTFNEAVLDSGKKVHRHADQFLEITRSQVTDMLQHCGGRLSWNVFDVLFKKITLQVIFGSFAKSDLTLTDRLERMMNESNRVFLLTKSAAFDAFYEQIRSRLAAPQEQSLSFDCAHAPFTANTKVENQVPHWMFAMMDTLAENTVRALALILADEAAEERVRSELTESSVQSPTGIENLRYLEGCIQEGMRLWPTTPILVRETMRNDVLCGHPIAPKTQVMIMNNFNHRDSETIYFADKFNPEFWMNVQTDYRFNHLSNGSQSCAGKNLALFIAKAVIATLFDAGRYKLCQPVLKMQKPLPYAFNQFRFEMTAA
jgi:cytochrome P450